MNEDERKEIAITAREIFIRCSFPLDNSNRARTLAGICFDAAEEFYKESVSREIASKKLDGEVPF